jgi:hypothetical protein
MFLIRNNFGIALQKTQGAISLKETRPSPERSMESLEFYNVSSLQIYMVENYSGNTYKWGKVSFKSSFKER